MTRFNVLGAGYIYDRESRVDLLVLAECEDGSGQRLEIQKARRFNSEDERLGWDTYCLSNEAGATHHGGITDWTLEGETLRIVLTKKASRVLRARGGYLLRLMDDEVVKETTKGLAVILSELERPKRGGGRTPRL